MCVYNMGSNDFFLEPVQWQKKKEKEKKLGVVLPKPLLSRKSAAIPFVKESVKLTGRLICVSSNTLTHNTHVI